MLTGIRSIYWMNYVTVVYYFIFFQVTHLFHPCIKIIGSNACLRNIFAVTQSGCQQYQCKKKLHVMLFQMQRWHEKEHPVMGYASFKTRYTLLQRLLSRTVLDVWFFPLLLFTAFKLKAFLVSLCGFWGFF